MEEFIFVLIFVVLVTSGALLGLDSHRNNEKNIDSLPKEIKDYMKDSIYMR